MLIAGSDGIKIEERAFPMYDTPTGKIIGGALLGKSHIGESVFPNASKVDPKVAALYYAADRLYNIGEINRMLDDGINAFSTEFQQNEFFRNQPVDIQECFKAYGVENYVDMLGKNEAPGSWYPMYSYSDSIPSTSECGKVKNNIVAVKKIWLPQVIMADDFDAAWNQYMEEYNACNPQIYFDYLQQKVNEN